MSDKARTIMDGTENILDQLFFNDKAAFSSLMTNEIKPNFADKNDQIAVLLGIFAMKEYTRLMELEELRGKFMESLLTPQAGELAH